MPTQCSSNALNGCAACGPSLSLWAISSSSSLSPEGHSAYDGSGKKYTTQIITASSKFQGSYTGQIWQFVRPPGGGGIILTKTTVAGSSNSNESGNITQTYIYYIDQYGDLYIWVDSSSNTTTSSSSNGQDYALCEPTGGGFTTTTSSSSAGGSSSSKGHLNGCTVKMDDKTNCSSSYNYSFSISSSDPNCQSYSDSSNGNSCGSVSFSINDPNPSATNKSEITHTNETVGCDPGSGFILYGSCTNSSDTDKEANLSTEVSKQFLYGKSQQIVNKKIQLKEKNDAQNCDGSKCGNGNEDDCWGDAPGFFYLYSNNLNNPNAALANYTKLKFKIGVIKESFKKIYKSVSGKIYFYYDENNLNPCCNKDFNGTIIKELSYSIGTGSSTFKESYLAADCGDVDNSTLSEGHLISVCVTVDNVSFL